jgi:hypothetical protein
VAVVAATHHHGLILQKALHTCKASHSLHEAAAAD